VQVFHIQVNVVCSFVFHKTNITKPALFFVRTVGIIKYIIPVKWLAKGKP
jgi:hypothetical protein